jgi:trypsin-like peptidase
VTTRRSLPVAGYNNNSVWTPLLAGLDCLAGHVGLELRNVAANYPFERSHRFAEIQPNSGFGDYSRLSCGVGDAQLERNKRIVDTEFFTEGSYVSHILLAPDPPIRPVEGVERASICGHSVVTRSFVMAEPVGPLIAFSDHVAVLVERVSASIVAVHGGGRWSSSGIHWRPGVIVTAEEALERDDELAVTLPGGRKVAASLAGRDPSTDVAALRMEAQSLPIAATADAGSLRPGHVILAVGSFEGAPAASLGLVAFVGSAWQSLRGGTIDSLLRLDVSLSPRAEGSAVVDSRRHRGCRIAAAGPCASSAVTITPGRQWMPLEDQRPPP